MKGLCLIVDKKVCHIKKLQETVHQAVMGGVTMVQYCPPNTNTGKLVAETQELKKILRPYNVPLIIQDRVDIALAVGADGLHLGQDGMPFELAKKLMPVGSIIGLSVETWEQLEEAQYFDLEYIMIKPVLPIKSDSTKAWGLENLQEAQAKSRHRLMAFGGITKNNIREIIKMGVDEIALTAAICNQPNPQQAARALADLLDLG